MQDLTIPLLQGVGVLAVAGLFRRRPLVLLAAVAALVAGLSVGFPADPLTRPPLEVIGDLLGLLVGTVLGLLVRRPVPVHQGFGGAGARHALRRRPTRRRGLWLAMVLVLATAAAVGLYLEERTVPQWRAAVDAWIATPAGRALGIGPPAAPPAAPVAHGAGATPAATPSMPARRPAPAERPRGDMRHCLDQGSAADVVRCAERSP